jgi:predicted DNA-binding transcriptional regulator YafY
VRTSRLLTILALLQQRTRVTADELARELAVSSRTIYRDMDELSAAGVPIYGDSGPGGGFALLDGPKSQLAGLAARARLELLAALPEQTDALDLGHRFHLDPVAWYRAAPPIEHLGTIVRAVADQRVLTMRYESWTTTRAWRVEPLGIVLKAGAWYFVGRSDAPRIFRVAAVHEAALTDARFERGDFDLAAFWRAAIERFERELRRDVATVRVTAAGRRRLAELGAYAERAVAAGPDERDGWARVQLPIEQIEQTALALLSVGPELAVIEPAALRERMAELARQIAARCAPPRPPRRSRAPRRGPAR